ncbi:hypothetical protein J1N35_005620 [Gossypium stocksii]|uniref:Uncharacterized protein n=1 Tax=Gossypium stocksii TaxID=47602 RepID=A0A9D3WG41_9ROSI|nr:hypothetical protein J1N35_005620 [Gossypium stocksii]
MPLSVEPSFGTFYFIPQVSPISSLRLTSVTSKVNIFFPWKDHINVWQYPFSFNEARQKWADLSQEFKECAYPSSSSMVPKSLLYEEWDEFHKEWRESSKLFYPFEPEVTSPASTEENSQEEYEDPKNVATDALPTKGENKFFLLLYIPSL